MPSVPTPPIVPRPCDTCSRLDRIGAGGTLAAKRRRCGVAGRGKFGWKASAGGRAGDERAGQGAGRKALDQRTPGRGGDGAQRKVVSLAHGMGEWSLQDESASDWGRSRPSCWRCRHRRRWRCWGRPGTSGQPASSCAWAGCAWRHAGRRSQPSLLRCRSVPRPCGLTAISPGRRGTAASQDEAMVRPGRCMRGRLGPRNGWKNARSAELSREEVVSGPRLDLGIHQARARRRPRGASLDATRWSSDR